MTELSDLQDKVIVMKGTIDQITASVNSTVTAQLAAEVELISQSLLNLSTKNPIAVREDMDVEVRKSSTPCFANWRMHIDCCLLSDQIMC